MPTTLLDQMQQLYARNIISQTHINPGWSHASAVGPKLTSAMDNSGSPTAMHLDVSGVGNPSNKGYLAEPSKSYFHSTVTSNNSSWRATILHLYLMSFVRLCFFSLGLWDYVYAHDPPLSLFSVFGTVFQHRNWTHLPSQTHLYHCGCHSYKEDESAAELRM